jgi:hypothetical protein
MLAARASQTVSAKGANLHSPKQVLSVEPICEKKKDQVMGLIKSENATAALRLRDDNKKVGTEGLPSVLECSHGICCIGKKRVFNKIDKESCRGERI